MATKIKSYKWTITLYDLLIKWSCKIVQECQCQWFPKLVGWWHTLKRLLTIEPLSTLTTWSCKVRRQMKPSYLHYKSVYGNQTWQNDNLPRRAFTYEVRLSLDHIIPLASWLYKLKSLYLQCHSACNHQN